MNKKGQRAFFNKLFHSSLCFKIPIIANPYIKEKIICRFKSLLGKYGVIVKMFLNKILKLKSVKKQYRVSGNKSRVVFLI